jgi:hypothetical protein
MTAGIRSALLLVTFVVGTGCTHAKNLRSCAPVGDEAECWQSSRADERGTVREEVVERVTPGGACDRVEIERTAFDAVGVLQARTIEQRRCGVVEARVIERYDVEGEAIVVESFADLDHDDAFEIQAVERMPLTAEQRAFALARRGAGV